MKKTEQDIEEIQARLNALRVDLKEIEERKVKEEKARKPKRIVTFEKAKSKSDFDVGRVVIINSSHKNRQGIHATILKSGRGPQLTVKRLDNEEIFRVYKNNISYFVNIA